MVEKTAKAPRGLPFSAVDDHQREHGQDDDADEEDADAGDARRGRDSSSVRMMSPSDRPSRRVDRNRTVMSCTAPAKTTPARSQRVPGQIAHLRREHRPDQRARRRRWRRKWWPIEDVAVGGHVMQAPSLRR